MLIALDHRHGQFSAHCLDDAHEQRGLAQAGAGHEIDCKHAVFGEPAAIIGCIGIVLGQNVLPNEHDLPLAHARGVCMRWACTKIQIPCARMRMIVAMGHLGVQVTVVLHEVMAVRFW